METERSYVPQSKISQLQTSLRNHLTEAGEHGAFRKMETPARYFQLSCRYNWSANRLLYKEVGKLIE